MIRLTAVSDVEISIDSKLGQENAMQANIVASTSLHQRKNNLKQNSKSSNDPKNDAKELQILTIK